MNIQEIFKNCESFLSVGKPASELEVRNAETVLGLTFPKDYRLFLLQYGNVVLNSNEIFGLGCRETGYPNIIFVRKSLEKIDQTSYAGLIPICTNGFGEYHFLIGAPSPYGQEGNIISLENNQAEVIADSFTDFMEQLAQ